MAFLEGLCAGSASAFSEGFGTKEQVENVMNLAVYDIWR